jgi:hypothetical protein
MVCEAIKDGVINDTMKASELNLDLCKSEIYSRLPTRRFSTKKITNCFNGLKKKHDLG